MHRLLNINLVMGNPAIPATIIEPTLNAKSRDWLRYSANAWLVWTDVTMADLSGALRSYLTSYDNLIIIPVHPFEPMAGSMPQGVWDWVNRRRDPATGFVAFPAPAPHPGPTMTGLAHNALRRPGLRDLLPGPPDGGKP